MAYFRISTVINVCRVRKCGVHEACAYLDHQPYDGPFIYQPSKLNQDEN